MSACKEKTSAKAVPDAVLAWLPATPDHARVAQWAELVCAPSENEDPVGRRRLPKGGLPAVREFISAHVSGLSWAAVVVHGRRTGTALAYRCDDKDVVVIIQPAGARVAYTDGKRHWSRGVDAADYADLPAFLRPAVRAVDARRDYAH